MDFSDALRAMKAGSEVYREAWNNDPAGTPANRRNIMLIMEAEIDGQLTPMMVARRIDGLILPFGGSQWDILGDDWEIAP
jgi:Protein of unknown function (DUF2829)